jgi:hypothetical protein
MMPQHYQNDSKNITWTEKIYKLFTLSPNLKRLDLQEIKSYYPDGEFEITDPWLPNNMGADRINAICHPGLAAWELPQLGKYKPVNVRTGAQLDAALLILRDVRQEMH